VTRLALFRVILTFEIWSAFWNDLTWRHLMAQNIKLIVYPVQDIEKAKAFYGKFLDAEPYIEGSYYVGYRVGDQEVGLDPNSKVGPIAYTDVKDIKSSLQAMIGVGAKVVQDVKDVGGGLLIAQVKDADGNIVGLRQGR
jgi:predicted enzyme related to lactoylglutathione lyase